MGNRNPTNAKKAGNDEFYTRLEDIAASASHFAGHIRVSGVMWFTNLDITKRHEDLLLYRRYKGHESEYPKYDSYDAIEVSKVKDIPEDWFGVMGVPITFMDKYNPEQFDIVGCPESEGHGFSNGLWNPVSKVAQPMVEGSRTYKRLFNCRHMS